MTQISKSRRGRMLVVLAAALTLFATSADARAGKSSSFGSRGTRTFDAPATTNTAPSTAAPMQRSATERPTAAQPGAPGPGISSRLRPGAASSAAWPVVCWEQA